MGSETLVDLVAKIWSLGSATINAVKNAASDPLGAIKAVGQFILNAVLAPIIDSFVSMFHSLFDVIKILSDEFISEYVTVNSIANGLEINGVPITIYRNDFNVIFEFNNFKIDISNVIFFPTTDVETLSTGTDSAERSQWGFNALYFGVLFGVIAAMTVPGNYQTAFRVFSTTGTLGTLTSIVNLFNILLTTNPGDTVRNDYLDSMIQYFLLSGVGFAFSLGMGYAATFIAPVGQIPEFFRMISTGLLGVSVEYKAGGDPSLTGFGLGFLFSGIGAVSTLMSPGSLNAARLTNWVLLFFNLVLALIFGAIRYL